MKKLNHPSASILRKLGIAPELMAIVITLDFILFGGELFTLSFSLPISILIGCAVGLFSIFWQRKKYGDSRFRAVTKGILLGVLTAIPSPLASVLPFLAGILSLFGDDETEPRQTGEKPQKELKQAKGRVIDNGD